MTHTAKKTQTFLEILESQQAKTLNEMTFEKVRSFLYGRHVEHPFTDAQIVAAARQIWMEES